MKPRLASTLFLLGFASGLPLILTDSVLKLWLKDAGIKVELIGMLSLVQLPYLLKVVWAPLLDRYVPPFLGRRRGWLMVSQLALAAALAALAFLSPSSHLPFFSTLALAIAFISATQDIATDAWRTETLPQPLQGTGTSFHIAAYRLAILVAAGGSGILADHVGWRTTYLIMAALMAIGPIGTWMAEEPSVPSHPRTLREAVVEPWKDFLARKGALLALLFIVLYKLGDQLATSLTPVFLRAVGFSKTAIGLTTKGAGIPGLILGGFLGGWLMQRWPLRRALFVFGLVQIAAILVLLVPAALGPRLPALVAAIALENLGFGMGVAAYMTLIMRLCDVRFTGTQFSLLTSLAALPRTLLASPAGFLAAKVGWPGFFLACALCALPGLAMLSTWKGWAPPEADTLTS